MQYSALCATSPFRIYRPHTDCFSFGTRVIQRFFFHICIFFIISYHTDRVDIRGKMQIADAHVQNEDNESNYSILKITKMQIPYDFNFKISCFVIMYILYM